MPHTTDGIARRLIVVGGSVAGISAVRALRTHGFAGEIVLISDEPDSAYDRPPLSKQFLSGQWTLDDILLTTNAELSGLRVTLIEGAKATHLDPQAHTVTLASGDTFTYDGLVVATGSAPKVTRPLDSEDLPARVHVLRSATHALSLAGQLQAEGHRLVVIGAGFLGSEIASTASKLGSQVTVLEADIVPMRRLFGEQMGDWLAGRQREAGIDLRTGVLVTDIVQHDDEVAVTQGDGDVLHADSVVVAIGADPNTDWLAGSGLVIENGLRCDGSLFASDDIVVAGDVASWWNSRLGRYVRLEHWTNAVDQAEAAARNLLLGADHAIPYDTSAYVWSDQFDLRLEVIGIPGPVEHSRELWGHFGDKSFVVGLFSDSNSLEAIVAVNAVPKLLPIRKALRRGAPWGHGLLKHLSPPDDHITQDKEARR